MDTMQTSASMGSRAQQWRPATVSLTPREGGRIERIACELLLKTRGLPDGPSEQVILGRELADAIEDVCPRLGQELARLKFESACEVVVVHGLPAHEERGAVTQLALSAFIGEVFNYATQNQGALTMRLEPQVGSAANTNTAVGEFEMHSDDAAIRENLRATWLSLHGIRNPRGTLTGYAPIRAAAAYIPQNLWNILFSARFSVRVPISFGLGDKLWTKPCPVLGKDDYNRTTIAWPSYATKPFDQKDVEASEALAALKQATERVAEYVALSPGTMLVFSNLHGVHKRTAITGDGSRLIFRNYIRPDLTDLQAACNHDGHIFDLRDVSGLGMV